MKLIEGRECGDCAICCEVLAIDEQQLNKPAGQICQHRAKQGCGIYEQRPNICRQWFCMWRWFPFANNVRPDKSNILISYENHPQLQHKIIIVRDLSDDGSALQQPGFEHIVQSMLEQGLEVWCHHNDRPIFQSTPENPLGREDAPASASEDGPIDAHTKAVFLRLFS